MQKPTHIQRLPTEPRTSFGITYHTNNRESILTLKQGLYSDNMGDANDDNPIRDLVHEVVTGTGLTPTVPPIEEIARLRQTSQDLIDGVIVAARWICAVARNSGAVSEGGGNSGAQILLNRWYVYFGCNVYLTQALIVTQPIREHVPSMANFPVNDMNGLRYLLWDALDDIMNCVNYTGGLGTVNGGAVVARVSVLEN